MEILTIFDGFGQSARFMAGLWLSRAGLHEYERDTFVEASWLDNYRCHGFVPSRATRLEIRGSAASQKCVISIKFDVMSKKMS